jgi:hypothetical protein
MNINIDDTKYTLCPTNEKLVFNLRVNDKLTTVIVLPNICQFNTSKEIVSILETAVKEFHNR